MSTTADQPASRDATDRVVLVNRSRWIVPLLSLAMVLLMFWPVMILGFWNSSEPVWFVIGMVLLGLWTLGLVWQVWSAPHTAIIDRSTIQIVSARRRVVCDHLDIADWRFARPDGRPSQTPPATHGLLMVRLKNGTGFRAEVTPPQAGVVARLLNGPGPT